MLALRLLIAVALLVGGLSAAAVAWVRGGENADAARDAAADAVTESVDATAATVIAGMGGGAGLVSATGEVSIEQFVAFQRDVAEVSSLDGLAYVPIVTDEERPSFEAGTGAPITVLTDDGFVPAPPRPTYWPVGSISPAEEGLGFLVGVDVQESELSAAAAVTARDTGSTILTEAVALTPELTLIFIIKPLYRPGLPLGDVEQRRAADAGFLASAYSGGVLGEGVSAELPAGVRYSVRDGDAVLAQGEVAPNGDGDGVERELTVGGRTWTVDVEDTRAVNHDLSWVLIVATLVLVGGLLYLIVRGLRYERAVARIRRLVGSTADLAQLLAGAATADEVEDVIHDAVTELFGAHSSRLVLVDAPVPSDPDGDVAAGDLGGDEPVDRARRSGALVLMSERGRGVAALPLASDAGLVVAVVEIVWEEQVDFDDINVSTLRTVAELCEQTLRRAGATDRVAARADQLARLAEGLAGASTVADVAERITDLGRQPVGASAASIGLIDRRAGVLRVNHGATVDDLTRDSFSHPPLSARLVFTDAARTGEAVIVPDYDEYERRYPDADATGLGRGARAGLPLRIGDEVIGALVFAWPDAQVFDDALMSNLSTIAKMATQSVIRAGLSEEQLDDAQRSRDLADFAQLVARVRTAEELVRAVVEHGGVPAGADVANVGLVDAALGRLEVQPHPEFDRARVEQFGTRSLDDEDLPGITAVRTGEPVVLSSREEIERSYPGRFSEATAAVGVSATVHLPLTVVDGTPIGTLGFAWAEPQEFSPATLATLRTLAELCAQTLDRVRLGEAEHHLVSSLQNRVVRPLPTVDGLLVAERYRPAARAVGMGGDWYEGIGLVDGRYALAVGDIAGHGIHAVSDMIQVRAVVGALLRSGVPLGDVFPQATGLLDDARSTVTATVGIVVVDPRAGTLSYVMAGHLPPLLRDPDGSIRLLDEGRQPLLGLPITPVVPGTAPFPSGSTLLAYTDGLVERRTESIDESMQRLVGVWADAAVGDLESLADDLLERCLEDEDPGDDVALVLLRNVR